MPRRRVQSAAVQQTQPKRPQRKVTAADTRKEGNYRRKLTQTFDNLKKEGGSLIQDNESGFKLRRKRDQTSNPKYNTLQQLAEGLKLPFKVKADDVRP